MKIYGLKNCDSCRKALKALPDAELADVSVTPVPESLMEQALARFGDTMLNTRSTTWRSLSPEERDRPAKDLLVAHPKLMKRPLIDDGGVVHLGWDKTTRDALGV